MRVVSTFHKPSSVVAAFHCRLSDREISHLVIAKTNQIEVHSLTSEGLIFRIALEIWGYAVDAKAVKKPGEEGNLIVVLTDHPSPKILLLEYVLQSFASQPIIKVVGQLSLKSRSLRESERMHSLTVSPDGRTIVAAPYVGKLRITCIMEKGNNLLSDLSDVNVREMTILSLAFIYDHDPSPSMASPSSKPKSQTQTLAILHEDYKGTLRLCSRDISPDLDLSPEYSTRFPDTEIPDSFAEKVVTIPHPSSENGSGGRYGGLLVVGGRKLFFYGVRPMPRKSTRGKGKGKEREGEVSASGEAGMGGGGGREVMPVSVDWGYSNVTAYTLIDEDGGRILLGDSFGRLVLVVLTTSSKSAQPELTCSLVGITSPPSSLTYLDCGMVYIGSHNGDHQLIQLSAESNSSGNHFKLINRTQNISPIMDACIIERDNNKEVVTASGGGNSGSLRIIRSGADLLQLANVDSVPYIRQMWALKSKFGAKYDDFLVCSTHSQTRIFTSIKESSMEEIAQSGFDQSVPTLACGNITISYSDPSVSSGRSKSTAKKDCPLSIQVTRKYIHLANISLAQRVANWEAPGTITVSSVSASQVAVALSGGRVYVLSVMSSKVGVEGFYEISNHQFKTPSGELEEISCLSIVPHATSIQKSPVVVVGFWGSNKVCMYRQKGLGGEPVRVFELPHIPRSVLLTSFQPTTTASENSELQSRGLERLHILIGLGDGTLYQALLDGERVTVLESRTSDLGERPVRLAHCRLGSSSGTGGKGSSVGNGSGTGGMGDGWGAFACGSRGTIVYYERGRAKYSPLGLKGITNACSVHFEHFRDCMAFGTSGGFIIGKIRDVQKLHIHSVPLDYDCPQRISHHTGYGVLGVGTSRIEPHKVGEVPNVTSHFSVFDDSTLQRLSTFTCNETEEPYSISTVSLFNGMEDRSYFALGTVFIKPEEVEPSKGRLLLFDIAPKDIHTGGGGGANGSRGSWLLTSEDVGGCVYSITSAEGLLLAAVNSAVYLYRLEMSSPSRPYTLTKLSEINHNYIINSISTAKSASGPETHIFVADTFNSVSLFKLEDAKIHILAKCYTPNWTVGMGAVGDKGCIGADNDLNLFSYRATESDDKKFLEREGFYHLGELVNRFLTGSIATYSMDDSLQALPVQLFFTSVGRIGVISELNDSLSFSLTELQRNLNGVLKGPGDITHSERRRPTRHTDTQPQAVGFLDGDFLEQYLSQSGETLERIRRGANDAETLRMSHQEVILVLEKLQSIH